MPLKHLKKLPVQNNAKADLVVKSSFSLSGQSGETDRRRVPKEQIEDVLPPILDIFQTARLLRCSVDTVRRIPLSELPRCYKPGKQALFLLKNIIAYIEKKTVEECGYDDLTSVESSRQADLLADDIRRNNKPRR